MIVTIRGHLPLRTALAIYLKGVEGYLATDLHRRGERTWTSELPCADRYIVEATDAEGRRTYADLSALDHRVRLLGKRCPALPRKGKPLLGIIPMKDRMRHRTYILRARDLRPEIPVAAP